MELLRARATALRENIARVHEISSLPDEQFWSSELHIEALKLRLIQAIEDASSISAHLLSRLGGSAPAGYVECFAGIHRRG
ncbi:MAG: HepT-like ribonuclease domain-containing protein, partial [Armatimonadota bacterium]